MANVRDHGKYIYKLKIENKTPDQHQFIDFNLIDNIAYFQSYANFQYESNGYIKNKLMISNPQGFKFETISEDIVCSQQACNFYDVESMWGMMFINVFKEDMVEFLQAVEKKQKKNYIDELDFDAYRFTQFSYDFGQKLKRIFQDTWEFEKEVICTKCFLNIHLQSEYKTSEMPKSDKRMPGLIIAQGNLGRFISTDENESTVGIFLTVDGGVQWKMIAKGFYHFELLDKGNIIVLTKRNEATRHIIFSVNSGQTFERMKITDRSLVISHIIGFKDIFEKKLVVVGNEEGKSELIALNFSNLVERICKHTFDEYSDYEVWKPRQECWNGAKYEYLRKKPFKNCFNKYNFNFVRVLGYCQCTDNDYHCDFGYKRNADGKCEIEKQFMGISQKPEHCHKHYSVSDGYRKNYLNSCQGGVQHKITKKSCS